MFHKILIQFSGWFFRQCNTCDIHLSSFFDDFHHLFTIIMNIIKSFIFRIYIGTSGNFHFQHFCHIRIFKKRRHKVLYDIFHMYKSERILIRQYNDVIQTWRYSNESKYTMFLNLQDRTNVCHPCQKIRKRMMHIYNMRCQYRLDTCFKVFLKIFNLRFCTVLHIQIIDILFYKTLTNILINSIPFLTAPFSHRIYRIQLSFGS